MKCYRYALEGYEDYFHCMGYFKGYKIFIPSPYNFSIFTLDDKIKYIKRQNQIDDFSKNYHKFNPKIYEIDMNEEIIKNLYNNLIKEEEIIKEREKLTDSILSFQTEEEKIEKIFNIGLELLRDGKYYNAIEKFKSCINDDKFGKLSYYNISCCYSHLKDKNNAIDNLAKSIDLGYADWFHIVSDYDLKNIIDESEVVEIIKKLIQLNPKKNKSVTYYNFDDPVDKYIKKHNLTEYYSKK